MKITTISATNVKGFSFTRHLGPVTLITGPNNSGKSATLRAIELGLIGYCPRLGQRISDTFQLSSGEEMSVDLHLDTPPESLRRTWLMDRKEKITYSGWGGELVPAVMLDAREYFELGAKDRMRYVFNHIPVGDQFKQEELTAEIKNNTRPKETDAEVEKVLAEIFSELEKPTITPIQEWLQQLVSNGTDKRKLAKDAADRMKKSGEAATSLGSDELPLNLQACERARNLLSTQLSDCQTKLATLKEQQAQFDRNATIRKNNTDLASRELTSTEDIESAAAKVEADLIQLEAHQPTFPAISKQLQAAQGDLSAKSGTYKAYEAETKRIEEEQRTLVHKSCCPSCGAQGKGFTDLVVAKFRPLLKVRHEEQARMMTDGTASKAVRDDLQTKANEAKANDAKMAALVGETRVSLRSIQTRLETARTTNRSIQSARDALANLPESDGLDHQSEIAGLATNLEALRGQRAAADQKVKQAAGQQANEANRLKAINECRIATIKADLFNSYVKSLTLAQERVVSWALSSLLEPINRVTSSIIPFQIVEKDGELGVINKGQFVPAGSDLLAGSWDAVLYSAIGIALAQSSPFKFFVLDEATRLDKRNKNTLTRLVSALVDQRVLDQVVVVDTDSDSYADIKGLTIISTT